MINGSLNFRLAGKASSINTESKTPGITVCKWKEAYTGKWNTLTATPNNLVKEEEKKRTYLLKHCTEIPYRQSRIYS